MRHISRIKIIAVIIFFALFSVSAARAAEIQLDAKNQSFAQGEEFLVNVFLNTEEESINAVEGGLLFPTDLLEMREIRDGNSVINFWIEKPHTLQSGIIAFSGITPGGLSGAKEILFSVIFRAKKEGVGAIEIRDMKALLNDGKGTEAKTEILNLEFRILKPDGHIPYSIFHIPPDTVPPENFKPEISRDLNLFEDKWFLVFTAQDKGAGVERYEVKETRQKFLKIFSKWSPAENLYILKDQKLRSYIFVKAIDKVGNERVAKIEPLYPLKGWYENYWIIGIIALGIIFACLLRKILWRKFIK